MWPKSAKSPSEVLLPSLPDITLGIGNGAIRLLFFYAHEYAPRKHIELMNVCVRVLHTHRNGIILPLLFLPSNLTLASPYVDILLEMFLTLWSVPSHSSSPTNTSDPCPPVAPSRPGDNHWAQGWNMGITGPRRVHKENNSLVKLSGETAC